VTGAPDTAHHDGLRTAVRRVFWLVGLLLGLWLLSWIIADEAHADGLGVHIPVVDQVVQPVVDTVVPDVGKVLDPVREPVGKVVQGLEKGPVRDLLKPVKEIVDALPAPVSDVVTPILKPVGDTVGGLVTDPVTVLPTTPVAPAPSVPAKVKPTHGALAATPDVAGESVATKESSVVPSVRHDFRIPVAAEGKTPKAALPNHSTHLPTGQASLSQRPDAPVEPGPAPATTTSAAGSAAAVVVHDEAPDLTAPGRLVCPHGVFAPLWRSLKPGTSPG